MGPDDIPQYCEMRFRSVRRVVFWAPAPIANAATAANVVRILFRKMQSIDTRRRQDLQRESTPTLYMYLNLGPAVQYSGAYPDDLQHHVHRELISDAARSLLFCGFGDA